MKRHLLDKVWDLHKVDTLPTAPVRVEVVDADIGDVSAADLNRLEGLAGVSRSRDE